MKSQSFGANWHHDNGHDTTWDVTGFRSCAPVYYTDSGAQTHGRHPNPWVEINLTESESRQVARFELSGAEARALAATLTAAVAEAERVASAAAEGERPAGAQGRISAAVSWRDSGCDHEIEHTFSSMEEFLERGCESREQLTAWIK